MSDNDKAQYAAMGEHITDFLSRADRAMEIYERMSLHQMAVMIAELQDICQKSAFAKFRVGDRVRKTKGSRWQGVVVGTYSTSLTTEGYAVESETGHGSVQIYPAAALELVK